MFPLSKALGDIPIGPELPGFGRGASPTHDYSHLLEDKHREALPGAQIRVRWVPADMGRGWLNASLYDANGTRLGKIDADVFEKDNAGRKPLVVSHSEVREAPREHNGQRLYFGRKLYEALMAHAKNAIGVTHIMGGAHSTYASNAHRALAEKHGLNYDPMPNIEENIGFADPTAAEIGGYGHPYEDMEDWYGPPESYDDRYGPYAYTLKAEDPISFSSVQGIPLRSTLYYGDQHTRPKKVFFDYSHLLTQEQRDKGYGLEVAEERANIRHGEPPKYLRAYITHPTSTKVGDIPHVGGIEAVYDPERKDVHIEYARTDRDHREQHLGRAGYEAIIAHMRNNHGAESASGGSHSTSAEVAHKAIRAKYGLHSIDMGGGVREPAIGHVDPSNLHYASFDYAFGPYAYKLRRYATIDGKLEIPLAKEEEPGVDPIMARLGPDQYWGYGDLEMLMAENGFNENHMIAAIRNNHIFSTPTRLITTNPMFTERVWDEAFQSPTDHNKINPATEKTRRNFLFTITHSPDSEIPSWIRANPQKLLSFINQQDEFDSDNDNFSGSAKDLSHRKYRHLKDEIIRNKFLVQFPDLINAENVKLGVINGEGQSSRRALIDKIMEKFPDLATMPNDLKQTILSYMKDLSSSLERLKARSSRFRELRDEFSFVEPQISNIIKSGLPPTALKGVTKKGLYMALLSKAPNFPTKKFNALLSHFMSPDRKLSGIPLVQHMTAANFLESPHIKDENWVDAIKAFGSSIPYDRIVKDPRFNDTIGKFLVDDAHKNDSTSQLIEALTTHEKFTQPLFQSFIDNLFVDPEQQKAEIERLINSPEYHRQDGTRFAMDHYGYLAAPYKQNNPYDYNQGRLKNIATAAPQFVTPDLVRKVHQRNQEILNYRHPDVKEELDYVPGHRYDLEDLKTDVYDIYNVMPLENRTPDLETDLARTLEDRDINVDDSVSKFLSTLGDQSINHLLSRSKNGDVLDKILSREDAKPEWVDIVRNRPDVISPEITEEWGDESDTDSVHHHQLFRQYARNSIMKSPGLTEAQLDDLISTAKKSEDLIELSQHPKFDVNQVNRVLAMIPSTPTEGYLRDPITNDYVYENGLPVRNMIPGNVPWDKKEHTNVISSIIGEKFSKISPEGWQNIINGDYINNVGDNDHIVKKLLENDKTPTNVLEHLLQKTVALGDRAYWPITKIITHPNANPQWLADAIEKTSPTSDNFSTLLESANLNPALVNRMIERYRTEVGSEDSWFGKPFNDNELKVLQTTIEDRFWNKLADSPHAPVEFLQNLYKKMKEFDKQYKQAKNSEEGFFDRNSEYRSPRLWKNIAKGLEFADPDTVYGEEEKPVMVRVGSHKLRGIRDIISDSGQPSVDFRKLPPGNYDKMRVVINNRKTNDVTAASVQAQIDALPAATYNISHGKWDNLQVHDGGSSNVFQLNLTNAHIAQLKAAGLWSHWVKVQKLLIGGHPVRPTTIGWVRYSGKPEDGTLHLDEVQSDIRPNRAQLVQKWRYKNGDVPFPHKEQDAVDRIILNGKNDHHHVILEAFHQWLRDRGHPGVVLHLPGVKFRARLSGLNSDEPPPVHYTDTYEKMPKAMGYNLNASKYGEEKHQSKTGKFIGNPFHTSPVRKFEDDLSKSIDDLPEMEVIRHSGGETIHDASDYLTPEQRAQGYTIDVRTGSADYGDYTVANLMHHGSYVGGTSALVDDPVLRGGEPRRYVQMALADIGDEHTGKRLGLPLYEATLASAKRNFGVTHLRGLGHSSLAHSVHKQLADKHGLSYEAEPNWPSIQYPTQEKWSNTPNAGYDAKYKSYSYTLKSELAKSFKGDIPPANVISNHVTAYDYSHLLPYNLKNKYRLAVVHTRGHPNKLDARLITRDGARVGELESQINTTSNENALRVMNAYMDREHRNHGLGRAMYSALYSHALNGLNTKRVIGGNHSSAAHGLHQSLAAAHGLSYSAEKRNVPAPQGRGHSFDDKYGPYEYELE